ncbi:MAG: hypothetical protein A3C84_00105 [Candidatus Ryanbacteria bacterium RIFCSPHIGHO2_02_FULL_48_12]|nr:MAG: hypothetical protein A3C84_00105 [Candidatus Ryanbacteria bacterium RIFCSPHIGHO2_02_FULL_48_12]
MVFAGSARSAYPGTTSPAIRSPSMVERKNPVIVSCGYVALVARIKNACPPVETVYESSTR